MSNWLDLFFPGSRDPDPKVMEPEVSPFPNLIDPFFQSGIIETIPIDWPSTPPPETSPETTPTDPPPTDYNIFPQPDKQEAPDVWIHLDEWESQPGDVAKLPVGILDGSQVISDITSEDTPDDDQGFNWLDPTTWFSSLGTWWQGIWDDSTSPTADPGGDNKWYDGIKDWFGNIWTWVKDTFMNLWKNPIFQKIIIVIVVIIIIAVCFSIWRLLG
jgi:hypothetical protein